jgi:hypothetical protein
MSAGERQVMYDFYDTRCPFLVFSRARVAQWVR